MGAYMLSTAILCYMRRVYRCNEGYGCKACNEYSRRRIGGPGHAMSSPSLPLSPLGRSWAAAGRPPISARLSPRLISRLLARLTTVSAEIAFKHATLFVLAAETHSR
jgi:hypothetical protein